MRGKGVQILRDHGVEVETGLLEEECLSLNEIFFHYITTKMPYVAMKYAMTLDGKIASFSGDSKWVTGEKAREHTHFLRKKYRGILVGIGTVLAAFTMGKVIGKIGEIMDRHLEFVSFLSKQAGSRSAY